MGVQSRRGFTLPETLMVVSLLGIVMAIIGQRVSGLMTRSATGNAASVVSQDLQQAVSLAGRQRTPIRLTCDPANLAFVLTDRASGAVLFRRELGSLTVTGLACSTSPVEIFPTGIASSALTITLTSGTVTRQVTMSSGGFARVVR